MLSLGSSTVLVAVTVPAELVVLLSFVAASALVVFVAAVESRLPVVTSVALVTSLDLQVTSTETFQDVPGVLGVVAVPMFRAAVSAVTYNRARALLRALAVE